MTKKLQILISVVAFLCFALSVNAQDFTNGGKYIFKNVESGKFLGAANSWGTQASLLNNSEYVIMWENGDGTYWIESQVSSGGTNYYLGSNGWLDSAPVSLAIIPSGDYYLMTPDSVSYYGYNGTSVMALNLSANDEGALWQIISVEDMLASFESATVDNPVDATFLILDPNFGRNNRNSWAWTIEATNWNLSGGNNTNNCAESWHSTFTLSQTLENMPSGIYKLSAQGFYRDDGTEEDYPYFFIDSQTRTFPERTGTENSMSDASYSFSAGLYTIEPITFVGGGDITIGAKLENSWNLWCIWDNFTLTYYGPAEEDPEKMMLDATIAKALELYPLEGLDDLVANNDVKQDYYSTIESALDAEDSYSIHKENIEFILGELSKSVAAYKKLFAKFDEWNRYIEETAPTAADNKDWQNFCWLMTEEDVSVNGLPNSSPYTIQHGNYSLSTEDIPDYINTIEAGLTNARFSLATFDQPYHMMENRTAWEDWTREFTGYGQNGTFVLNTWSTEAEEGDGTDMTTPFIESWVSDGYVLSDARIYQPLVVAPGLYKLTIDARLYGYDPYDEFEAFEGIKMFFGEEELNLQDQGNMRPIFNVNKVLWSKDYFSIVAIVEQPQILDFGFEIENANFSWLSFKNVSVDYYGNENVEENAIALLKSSYSFDRMTEQTTAHPTLIAAYNEALDIFEAAKTKEEIQNAANNANNALEQINENIAAFDNLFSKFNEWTESIKAHPNAESNLWTNFVQFMTGQAEVEGYPTPVPFAITNGNYALYNENIEEYISTVGSLYRKALLSSITESTDCTDMLINPSFSTGDFTGWTYRDGKLGNQNVECYEQVVDIYQIVEDVPDGIYSISVQAFERPANNGGFDGSEASKVFLYMNNFKTPVQNICKDAMPLEKAEPATFDNKKNVIFGTGNCYLDPNGISGAWPYDYQVDTLGYVPNSIDGARIAFDAGRYVQKCYGVVEDGVMKIGLTSNNQYAHWVLWANFKLTYEGKSATALAKVLPTYMENLQTYAEENELTEAMMKEIQDFTASTEQAIVEGDADVMWAALLYANDLMEAARENASALVDYYSIFASYEEACSVLEEQDENHSSVAWIDIENMNSEIADSAYLNLNTDNLIDLSVRMTELTRFVRGFANNQILIDGIFYTLLGDNMTAKVVRGDGIYYGQIVIPESVTFDGNTYRVTEIDNTAFYSSGVTEVTIPNTITTIGVGAFEMSRLTSITIPSSVTSIGVWAFACSELTSIQVESGNPVYDSRNNCNAIIETASKTLIAGCKNSYIPQGVTSIGIAAFAYCYDLTDIYIPEGVTSFYSSAFWNCYRLTSINLPSSVTRLIGQPFGACNGLTDVYCLAKNVPETDYEAFDYVGVEKVTLHVPAASIDDYLNTEPWSNFGNIVGDVIGDNYLAINDVKAFVGKQIMVPVELVNDSEITGIQFDLILPEGITLEDYEWAGRQGKKHSANFDYNEETGTYTMLIFSSSSDPFIGNDGTLINLVLNVDATMEEGQYGYGITNIKLVTPNETTFNPTNTYAALFISNTLRGDANGDGVVDVTDVVSVVNYILGRPSNKFNFNAADVNSDGMVDITDVVGVVNIILQKGVNAAKNRDMEVLSNALMMLNEHDGMNVLVEDAAKFAAMQFDVVVSGNENLLDAILNSSSDHQIGFAKIGANRYRVIAYSTDNDSFQPTEDTLIQLVLSNGNATIENATFVAADGHSVQMKVTGDATSIAGISSENQKDVIYNMAGQRVGTSTKSLSAGIYIRNGKKIRVK